jgi:hypothetical protein
MADEDVFGGDEDASCRKGEFFVSSFLGDEG